MAVIINGRKIAQKKEQQLKKIVEHWVKVKRRKPVLISLVAKEDKLGLLYTGLKKEAAARIGIEFRQESFSLKQLKAALSLLETVVKQRLNGLIVQKPGQKTVKQYFNNRDEFRDWWLKMTTKIPEAVDVDCLNPLTLGRLLMGEARFYPATVKAVYQVLLEAYKEKDLVGKVAVVVGSSEILGKPLALLLRDKGMSVTLLGSSCKDLGQFTRQAQVVISAVGRPGLIRAEMISQGTMVIDAGMSQVKGKPLGDVDFEGVKKKAGYLTPVPGGIGPLTVVNLMANVIEALTQKK